MNQQHVKEAIQASILEWDFQKNGTITQAKVADSLGLKINDIRYDWLPFKNMVQGLNNSYKIKQLHRSRT